MNRKENKPRQGSGLHKFLDSINSVHYRHGDINHNNVRLEVLHLGYKRSPVARGAYDLKVRQEDRDLGFKEFVMVISQEYARANQASPPSKAPMHSL
jgi:hypothetical protein